MPVAENRRARRNGQAVRRASGISCVRLGGEALPTIAQYWGMVSDMLLPGAWRWSVESS